MGWGSSPLIPSAVCTSSTLNSSVSSYHCSQDFKSLFIALLLLVFQVLIDHLLLPNHVFRPLSHLVLHGVSHGLGELKLTFLVVRGSSSCCHLRVCAQAPNSLRSNSS